MSNACRDSEKAEVVRTDPNLIEPLQFSFVFHPFVVLAHLLCPALSHSLLDAESDGEDARDAQL